MISTHILDLQSGSPAASVVVVLQKRTGEKWASLEKSSTNSDGRIAFNCPAEPGIYQLQFQIDDYFKKQNTTPFFIDAQVTFHITDTKRKYHVPLLLSPFGYSTYRGS